MELSGASAEAETWGVFVKSDQRTPPPLSFPWADRHPLSLNTDRRKRHFPLHSAGEDGGSNSELSLQGKGGTFHLDLSGLVG